MKPTAILFLLSGIALSCFGYWGMFTRSGGKAYEEMDGMIPFFALVAGIILLLISFILLIRIAYLRKKKG